MITGIHDNFHPAEPEWAVAYIYNYKNILVWKLKVAKGFCLDTEVKVSAKANNWNIPQKD